MVRWIDGTDSAVFIRGEADSRRVAPGLRISDDPFVFASRDLLEQWIVQVVIFGEVLRLSIRGSQWRDLS